jgi:hypothetical protein
MTTSRRLSTAAGTFVLVGLVAGLLSVVPVLEQADYLARLADSQGQVVLGAVSQAVMVPASIGFALCLYPVVRRGSRALALGFVGLRLVSATCHLVAVVLLAVFLELGTTVDPSVDPAAADIAAVEVVAEVLRRLRDLTNHVAVILPLMLGDAMLFVVLHGWRLVPRWLPGWGLVGAGLASMASGLVLAGVVEVVSPLYLSLNVPIALHSVVMAAWLIGRGLDTTTLQQAEPSGVTA